jgi:hypothetical protein
MARWEQAGFTGEDARRWNRHGLIAPEVAAAWINAGYCAEDLDLLLTRLDDAHSRPGGPEPDWVADDWLDGESSRVESLGGDLPQRISTAGEQVRR